MNHDSERWLGDDGLWTIVRKQEGKNIDTSVSNQEKFESDI
jgi:hypothetical protein